MVNINHNHINRSIFFKHVVFFSLLFVVAIVSVGFYRHLSLRNNFKIRMITEGDALYLTQNNNCENWYI
jgi:hypothetical protein